MTRRVQIEVWDTGVREKILLNIVEKTSTVIAGNDLFKAHIKLEMEKFSLTDTFQ